ncbi:MAG TPA: hypothetical protein VM755_17790 [Stellaceae bacterium]|nr:hypothetical protein [Stellaceae bacterium]
MTAPPTGAVEIVLAPHILVAIALIGLAVAVVAIAIAIPPDDKD